MRPIHLARLDKTRPVLILTRPQVRPESTLGHRVAPITSTTRGLTTELAVGRSNGLEHESVISLDNIITIPAADLGRQLGRLLPGAVEAALLTGSRSERAAFDLD